ncbi:fungal-specific transcription factor domain-containing protein [Aspergillus pseudoustus]|uniref:Fungal-specific transcription factor domain-containing protein n=1 Tax=Aspergillus pseudoustus TaxID=1810923 RepID=A0ABR4JC76_9EURO
MRTRMRPRTKPIACRRCHARKVKCSGESPCEGCRKVGKLDECVYPRKDRVVQVSQQYIADLVAENERLRQSSLANEDTEPDREGAVLSETPWFVNTDTTHTPILVAESSDSAFATRFRQVMSSAQHAHLPRVHFPTDEALLELSDADCPWPSSARARLLVRIAIKCLGRCYHIVRPSSILEELECAIRAPSSVGIWPKSKLWAIFAIGEMYATKSPALGDAFPGILYFARAMRITRIVSERPTRDAVEILLLLSFYSLCLNRRHSAYSLAGSAVRTAVIMGLHLNIPVSQLSDACEREHRNRVWWTAYCFDRMWAAKLGYPTAIRDDEIEVDLPSNPIIEERSPSDFPDRDYFVARIGLSRLSGRIVHSIYGKPSPQPAFSLRVHEAFRDLRHWLEDLPVSLQIDPKHEGEMDPRARSLHLLFHQLVILATRPILLHVLRTDRESNPVPSSAVALADTCVRCARHSCQLLTDSWANGSFMIFDFFYTQYLFAAATVLGISGLLEGKDSQDDKEQFDVAVQLLSQLKCMGNYAAAEFHSHIDATERLMEITQPDAGGVITHATLDPITMEAKDDFIALSEPFLADLLDQPLSDLEFIDASMYLPDMYLGGDV